MPKPWVDPKSGAVIMKRTPEEKLVSELRDDVKDLKTEIKELRKDVAILLQILGKEEIVDE